MALLAELRSTPRLRIGLVLIAAILGAYGLLEWRDRQVADRADYQRTLTQLARLSQPQEIAAPWGQRASEAAEVLAQARAELWRNVSTGQAQAQVQDWLSVLLKQADSKSSTVRVSEPDTDTGIQRSAQRLPMELAELQPLRARIEFNTDPAVLLAVLAALNDSPRRIGVDSLSIKPLKTEMQLSFWFEIRPEGGS
jgi:hypothetical protein